MNALREHGNYMYGSTNNANLEIENKLNADNSIESWSWKPEDINGRNYGTKDVMAELYYAFNLGRTFSHGLLIFPTLPNLQQTILQQYIVEQKVFDTMDLPYTEQVFILCLFYCFDLCFFKKKKQIPQNKYPKKNESYIQQQDLNVC